MARGFAHLLGALALLLTVLLWFALLHAHAADRLVNHIAGARNEYRIVLGTSLLTVMLSFAAAMRGAKGWLAGVAFSIVTLAFFTYVLST